LFLRGSEFVAMLRQRPSWDWRVREETTSNP
jgi:hypothetical protein